MCERLDEIFTENPRRIAHSERTRAGRLCLRRADFLDGLCGYDERFIGWGLEDNDLFSRACFALGLEPVSIAGIGHVIDHSTDERLENTQLLAIPDFEALVSALPENLQNDVRYLERRDPRLARSWVRNARFYLENWREKRTRVVAPGSFGKARLVDHRGHEMIL